MKKEQALINVYKRKGRYFQQPFSSPCYQLVVLEAQGRFEVDLTEYTCAGKTVLFLSPFQYFKWKGSASTVLQQLEFHGDFYCIEYHKEEVACNGLLFNNVYLAPHVWLKPAVFAEVCAVLSKIKKEQKECAAFSTAVLKAYLQLVLALCSKEKKALLDRQPAGAVGFIGNHDFQQLLEQYYLTERTPSFYAEQYSLSVDAFSKKIRRQFGKTPSQLIQDRVILEAKKLLHLTQRSVKEIAAQLEFEDVFYFSRYFKKHTGCAPTKFRAQTGISVVAK
ncbi:helix-turn-helix domain-containing protein [Niabella drilacis]|uniref:AraC-type DNA-binding protein n=1 Tax=Niabella drilacis (strain DSM 25811 / CCM 8410 / CCUG 62505 / LMG 26954 / E90) TaxID=1285928 RepID=A0A1G6L7B2_NIADE|nr:helix-turn-helix domain-containing protein [Niabella drilacis]SDC39071.1 AraC-type DNA-binding protein [Niabella drilacis]